MDAKTKLALLGVFYTIATVVAYCVLFAFGWTEEFDWRFWVGSAPQVIVTLVFGYLSSSWKQVLGFSLITSLIDMIFLGTTWHFAPDVWEPAIIRQNHTAQSFILSILIVSLIISFLLFGLGFLTSGLKGWITRSA